MRPYAIFAPLLFVAAAHAQSSTVWRFWRMADGMYESYIHSAEPAADGSLWVTHGRNVFGASIMDGYGIRRIDLEHSGPRPFDRLFGEPGGWGWGITPDGFRDR